MAANEDTNVHVMCLGPGGTDGPAVRAVCQLRNGGLLVAAEDRSLSVWDVRDDEEGKMVVELRAGVQLPDLAAAPRSAASLPDGAGCIVGDQAGGLTLLVEGEGQDLKVACRVPDAHSTAVISVAAAAGAIVTGGWDGKATEWKLDEAGTLLERVGPVVDADAECNGPCTVAVVDANVVVTGHAGVRQPDGRITDTNACVWKRVAAGAEAVQPAGWVRSAVVHGHSGPVRAVAAVGDAAFATCGNDGVVVAYRLDGGGQAREAARAQLPAAGKPGAKTLPVSVSAVPSLGMLCVGTSDGGLSWFRVGRPAEGHGERWEAAHALLGALLDEPAAEAPWLQRIHHERMPGPVWTCEVLDCGMVLGAAGAPLRTARTAAFLAIDPAGTEAELSAYHAAVTSWLSAPAATILASSGSSAPAAAAASGGVVQRYVALPGGQRVPVAAGGVEGVQGQVDGEHSYFELEGKVAICRWDQAAGVWQPTGFIDEAFVVTTDTAAAATVAAADAAAEADAPLGAGGAADWDFQEVVKFGARDLALRFRWHEHPLDVAARFLRQHGLTGEQHQRSTLQYVLAKRHEAGYFDDDPPRIAAGRRADELSPQVPAADAAAAGGAGAPAAPASRHFPVQRDALTEGVKVRPGWSKALAKKNADVPAASRWTEAELARAGSVCERLLETGHYHTWSGKDHQETNAAFVSPLVQAVRSWPAEHTGPVLDVLTAFCHACPASLVSGMPGLAETIIGNLSVRPAAGSIAPAGFGSQFLCVALGAPELAEPIVGQLDRLSGAVGELLDSLRERPLVGALAKQARHLAALGRMLQLVALAVAERREVRPEEVALFGSALLAVVEEVEAVAPADAWAGLTLAAVRALGTMATARHADVRRGLREDGVAEALAEACHLGGEAAEAAADLVRLLQR